MAGSISCYIGIGSAYVGFNWTVVSSFSLLNVCLTCMCFGRCCAFTRLFTFCVIIFPFCMLSRVYTGFVLSIHPFRLPWSFVAGGAWPFSHGAAGLVHVVRTHGF